MLKEADKYMDAQRAVLVKLIFSVTNTLENCDGTAPPNKAKGKLRQRSRPYTHALNGIFVKT